MRTVITILILLFYIAAYSQPKRFYYALLGQQTSSSVCPLTDPSFTKPLDTYTATIAYGLRKLRTAYAGPAIQVRRSVDNAVQDIGFTPNGNFNCADYVTFRGSGTATIVKLYDQSGNGIDAVPSTTSTLEVELNTLGGKPTMKTGSAAGGAKFTFSTSLLSGTRPEIFLTARVLNYGAYGSAYLYRGSTPYWHIGSNIIADYNKSFVQGGNAITGIAANDNVWRIYNAHTSTTVKTMEFNGVAYTRTEAPTAIPTGTQSFLLFGRTVDDAGFFGHIAELIIFNSELASTDRTAIRSNTNTYYPIY